MTVRPRASSPSAAPKTRPCRSCGSRTATEVVHGPGQFFFLISQVKPATGSLPTMGSPIVSLPARRGDGQVLALLDPVEVHVHHDLVVLLADALPPDVRAVQAHALEGLGHLVGVEALGLLDGGRPEEHAVVGAGHDVGVHVELLLELGVEGLHVRVGVVGREVGELDEALHRLGDGGQVLLEQEAVDPGQLVLLRHAERVQLRHQAERVGAREGQEQHVGARLVDGAEPGAEVLGVEGGAGHAHHLAAELLDRRLELAPVGLAHGVVGVEDVDALAHLVEDVLGEPVGLHPRVGLVREVVLVELRGPHELRAGHARSSG